MLALLLLAVMFLISNCGQTPALAQTQPLRIVLQQPFPSWNEKTLAIALSQIGLREGNRNNDIAGGRYHRAAAIGEGNPYCNAGIYWSGLVAIMRNNPALSGIENIIVPSSLAPDFAKCVQLHPLPRTGLVAHTWNVARAKGKSSVLQSNTVRSGDLIVWRYDKTISGHIGMVNTTLGGGWVQTIEFNTTFAKSGDERDGRGSSGGVGHKRRYLGGMLGRMRFRGIISFD